MDFDQDLFNLCIVIDKILVGIATRYLHFSYLQNYGQKHFRAICSCMGILLSSSVCASYLDFWGRRTEC